jgi:hypothetical protein
MLVTLSPKEMDKLANIWEYHRQACTNKADMTIELQPGGGIGTVVMATCGCGKKMNVTDYLSW